MNYQKIYDNIIANRKQNPADGYTECHHIVPRCLGGSNDCSNLVNLTAREHFICHLLLTKIYQTGINHHKMIKAFMMMLCMRSNNQDRYISSRIFANLRQKNKEAQSILQLGVRNSQYNTKWIYHDLFGPKRIKFDLIEEYINQGWVLGKTYKYAKQRRKKSCRIYVSDEKLKRDIETYRSYYKIYREKGFDQFVLETGYAYSKPNLVQRFAKLLPEFIPQNGKKLKPKNKT